MQKDCIDSCLLCSRKLNIIIKSYEKKAIGVGDYEFGRFEVNTSQGQVYKSYKHGLYSSPNQI